MNARLHMMLNKLKIEVDNGRIENEWACDFIYQMYEKSKLDFYSFSEKQIAKIEELFERY